GALPHTTRPPRRRRRRPRRREPDPADQSPVPPTVIRAIRSVGDPLPTGAAWPSLPHTPSHESKSPATASTALMTSIARPIRFAPRTGAPTRPLVIRYPSLTPNTKSPVAGSTWPPPRAVTNTPRSVEARISLGSDAPFPMFVFVIRGIGGWGSDSRRPLPVPPTLPFLPRCRAA